MFESCIAPYLVGSRGSVCNERHKCQGRRRNATCEQRGPVLVEMEHPASYKGTPITLLQASVARRSFRSLRDFAHEHRLAQARICSNWMIITLKIMLGSSRQRAWGPRSTLGVPTRATLTKQVGQLCALGASAKIAVLVFVRM